jgi:hypothetical protein
MTKLVARLMGGLDIEYIQILCYLLSLRAGSSAQDQCFGVGILLRIMPMNIYVGKNHIFEAEFEMTCWYAIARSLDSDDGLKDGAFFLGAKFISVSLQY